MLNTYFEKIKEGKLIAVYSDKNDTEKFAAGFFIGKDDENIVLAHISPYGKYDGYLIKRIEDVFSVEYDNDYCNKLESLYRLQNQAHATINLGDNAILAIIEWAYENKKIVSLELCDSGYTDIQGYINSIDSDSIEICKVDDYGEENGSATIEPSALSGIKCDSENEIALNLLFSK